MPVVSIPFVGLAGDDVNGLDAEGVGGPEGRGDVAEVGEALDDEAHGVAPAPDGVADPVPPRLEDVGLQHLHHLLAGDLDAPRSPERVQVREPPPPPVGVGAALQLHEAAHPAAAAAARGGGLRGEEVLDGVDALVGVGVRVRIRGGGGGGEGGGAEKVAGAEVEAEEEAEGRMRGSGARGVGGEGGGQRGEG